MKTTSRIDSLRRIMLLKEVDGFGWSEKTELSVTLLSGCMVVLTAQPPCCGLCGENRQPLIAISDKYLCHSCLAAANMHKIE